LDAVEARQQASVQEALSVMDWQSKGYKIRNFSTFSSKDEKSTMEHVSHKGVRGSI